MHVNSTPTQPKARATPPRALAIGPRAIGATIMAAGLGLTSCGRSAPVDALGERNSDPDIAGVSVTSPDAVVSTVVSSEVETTTSSVLAPQQILYTVQPGDTLSVIASTYNVTVQDLADYNGITNVNSLSPGQELAIPPQPIELKIEDSEAETSSE